MSGTEHSFFAMMSRMKYINRWALMRNSVEENISEHSLEVAMLSHGLAVLGNLRLGKEYDPDHVAVLGMFHDCTEIITGDMPTPIKYQNEQIQSAYKQIEKGAAYRLLNMLPKDLQEEYRKVLIPRSEEEQAWKLVKAADKLSALIKCIEEEKAGNQEFRSAKVSLEKSLRELECPEADLFYQEFLSSYYQTLDELQVAGQRSMC